MAISPDGKVIYLPSFEKDHWHVVDALDGDVIAKIVPHSGAHNTVYGLDGKHAYLAGLEVAPADGRRHDEPHGGADRRALQRPRPAVHRQRAADPLLRERQRPARLRGGRPDHRQGAPSGRGAGIQAGPHQAARLPEPRHRPDAGREGTLGRRRGQHAHARLRRDRDAPPAGRQHPAPRRAGLGHVQPRRPATPTPPPAR